jgi:hypothetical protein
VKRDRKSDERHCISAVARVNESCGRCISLSWLFFHGGSHAAQRAIGIAYAPRPSVRKTLDLGSREFDIRTPEMQSGADCFPRRIRGETKLTGSFTGSRPFLQ